MTDATSSAESPLPTRRYPALNLDRSGWYAVATVIDDRVHGRLYGTGWDTSLPGPDKTTYDVLKRDHFNVKLSPSGRFKVDIGTGSGVSVTFSADQHRSLRISGEVLP